MSSGKGGGVVINNWDKVIKASFMRGKCAYCIFIIKKYETSPMLTYKSTRAYNWSMSNIKFKYQLEPPDKLLLLFEIGNCIKVKFFVV